MIKLVEKIQALIDAYHASNGTIEGDIKAIIQEWTEKVETHKLEYIKQQIREGIKDVLSSSEKTNKVFNQKLKALISEVKQQVLPEANKNKPADYAVQVNNALQFLSIEGSTINDESAYMILKGFVDDFDQMILFKRYIEKQVFSLEGADGNTLFPKTFGKLNKFQSLLNHFTEIESIANMLFIHKRELGETFIMNGEYYSVPIDGYEQMTGEEAIIELAKDIEEKANEVMGIGHISDQTEHEMAE